MELTYPLNRDKLFRPQHTLTVEGMRQLLATLPGDMPLLATWETTVNCFDPEYIELQPMELDGQTVLCLIFDVERHI